jgi:hypothetical protein
MLNEIGSLENIPDFIVGKEQVTYSFHLIYIQVEIHSLLLPFYTLLTLFLQDLFVRFLGRGRCQVLGTVYTRTMTLVLSHKEIGRGVLDCWTGATY